MASWSDREKAEHPGIPLGDFRYLHRARSESIERLHFIADTPYFDMPSAINSVDFDAFWPIGIRF
jgi:hypothetical protein